MKYFKMMIGSIIAFACIVNASVSFAALYLGTGLGVRPLSVEFSDLKIVGVEVNNLTLAATSSAQDLTIGYDALFANHIYFGGELFGEFTHFNPKISLLVPIPLTNLTLQETLGAKIKASIGGGFLLGYQLEPHFILLSRVGVIVNRFSYSTMQTISGFNSSSVSKSKTIAAAQLGLGFLYNINQHLALRGEYTYSIYPHVNLNVGVQIPVIGHSNIHFKPKASINAATLSLIYRIN